MNGKLTEGFLYDGQLNPVAETDASGQIVEQFIYSTRPNVPDYIIKSGVEYRVITDQVGSPVLIVNASTGAIAEQISYDAWGNITADSNPGFQPFGFAGGLYDPDVAKSTTDQIRAELDGTVAALEKLGLIEKDYQVSLARWSQSMSTW